MSDNVPSPSECGADVDPTGTSDHDAHQIPTRGSTTSHVWDSGAKKIPYHAIADWTTLRNIHQPVAKMFHVAYLADVGAEPKSRPLTFVFNGGPGAASAFLHMGAVGPQRVSFGPEGSLPAPPARVVENAESWLDFTDLVFIDPLGTGFSRALKPLTPKEGEAKSPKENQDYWEVDRDVESLGDFITRFLSAHGRWLSPIFIAGESYGGFRVAKMAAALQQHHGVGICGAMLISPAIEFDGLFGSDYNLTHWIEVFPSLVAAAHRHQRSCFPESQPLRDVLAAAESFATSELLRWLAAGDSLPAADRTRIIQRASELLGLPAELIAATNGRIGPSAFCRELLRDQRRFVGRYDASVTTADPYPDRPNYEGPDPTLLSIDRLFASAVNHQLRDTLQVDTELEYRLLSMSVHANWQDKTAKHAFRRAVGSLDDLRYGMSLNEHMEVFVSHGYYDLITPYYSSGRLSELMKLNEAQRGRLLLKNYQGGHMYYSWDESRVALRDDTQAFYAKCLHNATDTES
ncbi:MAG: hypothetical protein KDB14_16730 [Planctomycetales bacterium]|nr:hypothetical protein [Planctomycetales bacterium]